MLTTFLYEYDLSNRELISIKEYSEIDKMKIYDHYLVLYEFINNDEKKIHIIDLDSTENFVFSTEKLNIGRSCTIPSVYDGVITYSSKNEDDGYYYIISVDIATNEIIEYVNTGDSNIFFAIRDDNYLAWISGTSSENEAFIFYNDKCTHYIMKNQVACFPCAKIMVF